MSDKIELLAEVEHLRAENKKLKDQIESFTADPYKKMYAGLLKQWNSIADDLNTIEISFDLNDELDEDEEDEKKIKEAGKRARINKARYDKFMEIMESLKKMTDSLEWLRKKTGMETSEDNKPKRAAQSPLENRLR